MVRSDEDTVLTQIESKSPKEIAKKFRDDRCDDDDDDDA